MTAQQEGDDIRETWEEVQARDMREIIERAIEHENPLVNPGHPFVVIGRDSHEYGYFPMGSSATLREASELLREKRAHSESPRNVTHPGVSGISIYDRRGMQIQPLHPAISTNPGR